MLAVRPALVAIALLCDAAAATTPGPTPGPTPSADKLMPQKGTCRRWGHPEAGEWNKDKSCCATKSAAACDAGYRYVKSDKVCGYHGRCQEYRYSCVRCEPGEACDSNYDIVREDGEDLRGSDCEGNSWTACYFLLPLYIFFLGYTLWQVRRLSKDGKMAEARDLWETSRNARFAIAFVCLVMHFLALMWMSLDLVLPLLVLCFLLFGVLPKIFKGCYVERLVPPAPGGESDVRGKLGLFMLFFGLAYFIGAVILFVILLIVYFVTMSVTRVDIGVWLVLWFLLTQAWGGALAWLTDMWTAQRQSRAAEPVAPKPVAEQARPTPGQLNKRFASWVETSSESAHAVLFSSLGIWLSPHFQMVLGDASGLPMVVAIIGLLFFSTLYSRALWAVWLIIGFALMTAAHLLSVGRRFAARMLVFAAYLGLAVANIREGVVFLARGRSGFLVAELIIFGLACLVWATIVCLFPRWHSFRVTMALALVVFYAHCLLDGLYYAKRQMGVIFIGYLGLCYIAAFLVAGVVLVELKYRRTLRHAHEMARGDASSYDEIWKTFVADETKLRALSGLVDAYKAAMAGAEKRSKRQAAPSVGDLFEQAYALQPLVVAKAEAIGGDAGAVVYGSTKTVARAFQKAWRSYGGDYRRLCDVVRVSIAFETIDELTACLERIVADDELELIPQGMEKCRFDPEYDPYAGQFVGYRDLQLGATFKSAETRDRGLDQHIIEIQLHLRVFEAIKRGHVTVGLPVHTTNLADWRMGSGHRTYVSCRNLRCS